MTGRTNAAKHTEVEILATPENWNSGNNPTFYFDVSQSTSITTPTLPTTFYAFKTTATSLVRSLSIDFPAGFTRKLFIYYQVSYERTPNLSKFNVTLNGNEIYSFPRNPSSPEQGINSVGIIPVNYKSGDSLQINYDGYSQVTITLYCIVAG